MRWFIEVSRVGEAAAPAEKYCVEAKQWQGALQEARKLRGDSGPLSRFAIELLDSGYRAVDAALNIRYLVHKAPKDAPLTNGAQSESPSNTRNHQPRPSLPQTPALAMNQSARSNRPRAPSQAAPRATSEASKPKHSKPASPAPPVSKSGTTAAVAPPLRRSSTVTAAQRSSASLPAAPADSVSKLSVSRTPEFKVIRKREEEATAATPITYREYAYLVRPGMTRTAIETLLWSRFSDIVTRIEDRPKGKFVQLAIFDHAFESRPLRAPLATLAWKDWRGEPVVTYPAFGDPAAPDGQTASMPPDPMSLAPVGAEPAETLGAVPEPVRTRVIAEADLVHQVAPSVSQLPVPSAPARPPSVASSPVASSPVASSPVSSPVASPPVMPAPNITAPSGLMPSPSFPPPVVQAAALVQEPLPPPTFPPAVLPPPVFPPAVLPPPVFPPAAAPATAPAEPANPVAENGAYGDASAALPAALAGHAHELEEAHLELVFDDGPASSARPALVQAAAMHGEPAAKPAPVAATPEPRRYRSSEDLITELFETMHSLLFLPDLVSGAEFILKVLGATLPCELTLVHIFDLNSREFVIVRALGPGSDKLLLHRTPDQEALLDSVMRRRRSLRVDDASGNLHYASGRWALTPVQPSSALCGAVQQHGRYLGAIELVNPSHGGPFFDSEVNALDYVCEQFADFVASRPVVIDPEVVLASREPSS
jgi:hypothetical protein